jgi:hypothetical protein
MPWNLSGSGRRLLVSRRSAVTLTDSSPVRVLNSVPVGAQDVAQVAVLEGVVGRLAQRVAADEQLDAAVRGAEAAVLQRGEAGLAHHPLEHHAAGQRHGDGLRLQLPRCPARRTAPAGRPRGAWA